MFKKSVYNVTTGKRNRGRVTVKYGVRKDANIMPAYKVTSYTFCKNIIKTIN